MKKNCEHLYLNDGNYEFCEKLFDLLTNQTQKNVLILQRVRDILLSSSIQYDTFSLLDLQNDMQHIFIDFGMSHEGTHFCLQKLSTMFDEFAQISFSDLEDYERKCIEKDIYLQYRETIKI